MLDLPALFAALGEQVLLLGVVWLAVIFALTLIPLRRIPFGWRIGFAGIAAVALVVLSEVSPADDASAPSDVRARLVNALQEPQIPSSITRLLEASGYTVEYVYDPDQLTSAITARDCRLDVVAPIKSILPRALVRRDESLAVGLEVSVGLMESVRGRRLLVLGPSQSRKLNQLMSLLRAAGVAVLVRNAPMAPATSITINPARRNDQSRDLARAVRTFTYLGEFNGSAGARVPARLRRAYDVVVWIGSNAQPIDPVKVALERGGRTRQCALGRS
jgi:hypothetical protein